MDNYDKVYKICVEKVCDYYATHRDLSMSIAGIVEPHEVNLLFEKDFEDAYQIVFNTKAADGLIFVFQKINDDKNNLQLKVYRLYDYKNIKI